MCQPPPCPPDTAKDKRYGSQSGHYADKDTLHNADPSLHTDSDISSTDSSDMGVGQAVGISSPPIDGKRHRQSSDGHEISLKSNIHTPYDVDTENKMNHSDSSDAAYLPPINRCKTPSASKEPDDGELQDSPLTATTSVDTQGPSSPCAVLGHESYLTPVSIEESEHHSYTEIR